MITLLTGDNHFLLTKRKAELEAAFLLKQPDAFGLERFDADEDNAEHLIEAMTVLAFLANERLVIVRNATRNPSVGQMLQSLLGQVPESTHVVFFEPNPDRRTSLYKKLQKEARVETFEPPKGQALHAWLLDYAREHDSLLSNTAAGELTRRVGTDQWALAQEIHKLSLLDQPSIEYEDIIRFVEPTLTDSIFDMLGLLIEGDEKAAIRVYRQLRASRVEVQEVIGMIAWQVQVLVVAVIGAQRPVIEIARETGFKPFSIERVRSQAKRVSIATLRAVVQRLSTVDAKLKSSRADKDALLELALIRSARLLAS